MSRTSIFLIAVLISGALFLLTLAGVSILTQLHLGGYSTGFWVK